jgi:hypothetical protein
MLKNIVKNNNGLAMIIVLTIAFIVLLTMGAITTMVLNSLEGISAQTNNLKANNNLEVAVEKLRGAYKLKNELFNSCSPEECVIFSSKDGSASCASCNNLEANLKINNYKVYINNLLLPDPTTPTVGSANVLITGYSNNIIKNKQLALCLNYCQVAGYNCGDDGCNGNCGTCLAPQTCGGGGQPGVCGSDIDPATIECTLNSKNGDTCGGGTVVDEINHVVAAFNNCSEPGCLGDITKIWETSVMTHRFTYAQDSDNGLGNTNTLHSLGVNFEAADTCAGAAYYDFDHWYLPASNELELMYNASRNGFTSGYTNGCYWASNEDKINSDDATVVGMGTEHGVCRTLDNKSSSHYIRCLRHYQ